MAQSKKRKTVKKQNSVFYRNMVVLAIFILSFLMVLLKNRLGFIGNIVAQGYFIVFGLTAYIAPLLILLFYFVISKKLINNDNKFKYLSIVLLWINALLIISIFFESDASFGQRIKDSYSLAVNDYSGEGFLGVLLHYPIKKLIANIGIYILTVVNIFFAYLTFFNVSFNTLVHNWIFRAKNAKEKIKERQFERKQEKYLPKFEDDLEEVVETPSRKPKINFHRPDTDIEPNAVVEPIEEVIKEGDKGQFEMVEKPYEEIDYEYPPIELLSKALRNFKSDSSDVLQEKGRIIVRTLQSFGIEAEVVNINSGPTVTSYEVKPSAGIKVSRIVNLSNDLSLSLATSGIRIEAPIPGKPYVGIEVPNQNKDTVSLRDLFVNGDFEKKDSDLTVALGKNLFGKPIYAKINEMPHVLIAGATGAGKSVCINTIIMSLIYKYSPDDVEFIMVDPKMVELSIYNGIPHLKGRKVVTDPARATNALDFAVREMIDRYEKFSKSKCKDISSYNENVLKRGEKKMPYLVVVIDELSDLMMESSKEVENHITRLAQMGRAAGVHLIIATQRPSVDVITGVIKANIPSRISFQVSSQIDSRTILDMAGAEKLLGKGDMLFYPAKFPKPMRVQGAFVSDKEVERVVTYIKNQDIIIEETDDFNEAIKQNNKMKDDKLDDRDELLDEAIEFVITEDQASISAIQRRFRVGYSRAGRMIDQMESLGIVGKHEGSKPRKVLKDVSYLTQSDMQDEELVDEDFEDEFSE
ncbi:MAG: hypothetical protein GXZ08_05085 [Tissierellia bacterium]|nr:hypothetical protein [Tissierellia bacterium]